MWWKSEYDFQRRATARKQKDKKKCAHGATVTAKYEILVLIYFFIFLTYFSYYIVLRHLNSFAHMQNVLTCKSENAKKKKSK